MSWRQSTDKIWRAGNELEEKRRQKEEDDEEEEAKAKKLAAMKGKIFDTSGIPENLLELHGFGYAYRATAAKAEVPLPFMGWCRGKTDKEEEPEDKGKFQGPGILKFVPATRTYGYGLPVPVELEHLIPGLLKLGMVENRATIAKGWTKVPSSQIVKQLNHEMQICEKNFDQNWDPTERMKTVNELIANINEVTNKVTNSNLTDNKEAIEAKIEDGKKLVRKLMKILTGSVKQSTSAE